jgi:hypothetical protein
MTPSFEENGMNDTLGLAEWSDTVAAFAPMAAAPPDPRADAAGSGTAPDPSAAEWAVRCSQRILELDARIETAQAAHLALFMSSRASWRRHSPHEAAERLYRLTSG